MRYAISAGLISDPGRKRERNEDCCQVVQPADADLMARKGALIIVADGMGGSQGGEVASRIAVETVARAYYAADGVPGDALKAALLQANLEIHRFAQTRKELRGMGSTCTALAIHGTAAYSAHVGDSRLYLVRDGAIQHMTEDHSAVMELVKKGKIRAEDARRHPDRNVILRALGGRETVEVDIWQQPIQVTAGDRFVLCTDGLHDLVTDEEIRRAALADDPAAACEALTATALERGGHDNITVAIVRVRAAESAVTAG